MAKETGIVLPWEKDAMAGLEMPDGLSYPDQILYLGLRMLYRQYYQKVIDRETAKKEKKKLIEKSEVAKLSLSEYLIKQGLDKEIVIVDGLNEVVTELRRIGNNINQLTYLANNGRIYTVDLSEVKQEIGKVWSVINVLQNKW